LLQALEKAALKPGSKILVRVGKDLNKGCMAIQLAKRVWRLTVIATCATADMELVLSMGADSTIGESAFDDLTRQSPFECVVDHVREHPCTLPATFCADGEAFVCDSTKHLCHSY
jgi:NADPH:quinone reductase-like Zn-dependent oxidoreductase